MNSCFGNSRNLFFFSGAAWLPFDSDTPVERVIECLRDSNAIGIATEQHKAMEILDTARNSSFLENCEIFTDKDMLKPGQGNSWDSVRSLRKNTPENTAYVIYTSGSTGKPKGIEISNRSVCHWLRAHNNVFGVKSSDLVYQGNSISFDTSLDEIWLSYLVGATIWIAPKSVAFNFEEIPRAINQNQITVLNTVPTLLSMLEGPMPSLRLVGVGGEPCPISLAEKWAKKNLTLFNFYGPTETTGDATFLEIFPGNQLTIGRPIPNYNIMVVDETALPTELKLVPIGKEGEICISGIGLAKCYLGRPDLTSEKFLENPFSEEKFHEKIYRTGDIGHVNKNGEIVCAGRVDDQVKLRGYRIELGEIESELTKIEGIGSAAVILRNDFNFDMLAAFVVLNSSDQISDETKQHLISSWKTHLSSVLPTYMVPSHFEILEKVPRLYSGKIDRKTLKKIPLTTNLHNQEKSVSSNEGEKVLFFALSQLFPGESFDAQKDFFSDLGGNSITATRAISIIRTQPGFSHVSVATIYEHKKLGEIAKAILNLSSRGNSASEIPEKIPPWNPPNLFKYYLCGLFQFFCVIFLCGFHLFFNLLPFLSFFFDFNLKTNIVLFLFFYMMVVPTKFLVAFLGKWIILGKAKPGKYPIWGIYFFRVWLAQKFMEIAPIEFLNGSPLLVMWTAALGAKMGSNVLMEGVMTLVQMPDLLEVSDKVTIGKNVEFHNSRVERGYLILEKITIGKFCHVGTRCVLSGNTTMQSFSYLEPSSTLLAGNFTERGKRYSGNPAKQVGSVDMSEITFPTVCLTSFL